MIPSLCGFAGNKQRASLARDILDLLSLLLAPEFGILMIAL